MSKNERSSVSLTKECITTALLILLGEKPYENISVTDLTAKAGVSRMAYYRNYDSKDDILVDYILSKASELETTLKSRNSFSLRELVENVALFLQNHYSYVCAAVGIGQGERLLNEMTKRIIAAFPEISENTQFRYITAYYIGAITGVFKEWVRNNMAEPVQDIAEIICRQTGSETIEKFEQYRFNNPQ